MDNKEIIVIEDRLERDGCVVVEFVSDARESYDKTVIEASAKEFVDMLDARASCGFCFALAKRMREAGY